MSTAEFARKVVSMVEPNLQCKRQANRRSRFNQAARSLVSRS